MSDDRSFEECGYVELFGGAFLHWDSCVSNGVAYVY